MQHKATLYLPTALSCKSTTQGE